MQLGILTAPFADTPLEQELSIESKADKPLNEAP